MGEKRGNSSDVVARNWIYPLDHQGMGLRESVRQPQVETGRRRRRRLEFDQRVRRRGAGCRTLGMVGRRWIEREPRVTGVVSGRRPEQEVRGDGWGCAEWRPKEDGVLEARRGLSESWGEEKTGVLRNKHESR